VGKGRGRREDSFHDTQRKWRLSSFRMTHPEDQRGREKSHGKKVLRRKNEKEGGKRMALSYTTHFEKGEGGEKTH